MSTKTTLPITADFRANKPIMQKLLSKNKFFRLWFTYTPIK